MTSPRPQPTATSSPAAAPLRFQHVAIVGKYQALGSRDALDGIAHFLHDEGCDVAMERDTAHNTGLMQYGALSVEEIGARCDLALVVGGDGTMLGIARQLARFGTPLVGINQGRLGFITDVPYGDYPEKLRPMLRGTFDEDRRALIEASVWRDERCVFKATALNDVVVNRGPAASMIELRVAVDGRFVASQRADGLIIASPTGSTAYALSAGGPMLHPAIAGWVMAPIAPHTLSNRPIVLPSDGEISVELVAGKDASANFDMQTFTELMHGDRIIVKRSPHQLRLLHPTGWSYFDTLRKKLHWNEGVA
jgi:NAD+ kinase